MGSHRRTAGLVGACLMWMACSDNCLTRQQDQALCSKAPCDFSCGGQSTAVPLPYGICDGDNRVLQCGKDCGTWTPTKVFINADNCPSGTSCRGHPCQKRCLPPPTQTQNQECTDVDCIDPLVCSDGVCLLPCPCAAGSVCRLGACHTPCTLWTDNQCTDAPGVTECRPSEAGGAVCMASLSNFTEGSACDRTELCGAGLACVDGACHAFCNPAQPACPTHDCHVQASGLAICGWPEGHACTDDSHCISGVRCSDGHCHGACDDSHACSADETCVLGLCFPACTLWGQGCAPTQDQQQTFCKPAPGHAGACLVGGWKWENDRCATLLECARGLTCVDIQCRTPCDDTHGCDAGACFIQDGGVGICLW